MVPGTAVALSHNGQRTSYSRSTRPIVDLLRRGNSTTEIVKREVQGHGGFQVVQFLTESVRQARAVEKIASWEDAVAHTKSRIKELRQSLRVFKERVERGEPWPGNV